MKTGKKKKKLAGVMAWPVSHSLSPQLHGYWLEKYGITGSYLPLAVRPEQFRQTLKNLPNTAFIGVNITLPHKETALEVVDIADDNAHRIGAVNTITVKENGIMVGSNTDSYGFLENIRDIYPDWQASAGPAVVLGAGGAARGICVALLDEGVPEIRLVNRTKKRADILSSDLGGLISATPWSERENVLEGVTLLVNTTALGMAGREPLSINLHNLPVSALVCDIVYRPLETEFLLSARARGNPVVDGLGMLLHQACPGFQTWFGIKPVVNDELRHFITQKLYP